MTTLPARSTCWRNGRRLARIAERNWRPTRAAPIGTVSRWRALRAASSIILPTKRRLRRKLPHGLPFMARPRLKEQIRKLLPRRVRTHRVQGGVLKGARISTSWHDYPGAILGTTERPLLDWFAHNVQPGETWLDIGAHYGYTAIALSQIVGGSGRVFAFEPVLATAGCITRTRELNGFEQMTVVPLGLNSLASIEALDLPTVRGMADSTIGAGAW